MTEQEKQARAMGGETVELRLEQATERAEKAEVDYAKLWQGICDALARFGYGMEDWADLATIVGNALECERLETKAVEERNAALLEAAKPFVEEAAKYQHLTDNFMDGTMRLGDLRRLAVAAAQPIARCEVTGNPCGTDTRPSGFPCPCRACVAARKEGV